MAARKEESEAEINDQFEQFLRLRQQVRQMQAGTPLLMRIEEENGAEDLRICNFWVSEDLHKLCWDDKDSNTSNDIQITSIEAIVAEPDAGDSGHASIILQLREGNSVELICATSEDFVTWKDGLEFLSGDPNPPSGAVAPPSEVSELTEASIDTTDQIEEELTRKLKQQQEATNNLRRDCETLREASARKDATIARLLADLQGRNAGNTHYNKTASSSQESDAHLAEREIQVLKQKNKQLGAALQAKQDTITELMDLLRRCLQRQELISDAEADEPLGKSHFQGLYAAVSAVEARVGAANPHLEIDVDSSSSRSSSPAGVHPDMAPMDLKEKAEAQLQELRKAHTMKQSQVQPKFAPPPRQSPKAAPALGQPTAQERAEAQELQSVLAGIAQLSEQLGRLEQEAATATESAIPSNPHSPAGLGQMVSPKANALPPQAKAASMNGHREPSAATRREKALQALNQEMGVLQRKKEAVENLAKQFEQSCREE